MIKKKQAEDERSYVIKCIFQNEDYFVENDILMKRVENNQKVIVIPKYLQK